MTTNRHIQLVKVWFLFDGFIALYPYIYWTADEYKLVTIGLPSTLVYFLAVGLSITLSIVYAYWVDIRSQEFAS